MKELLLLVCSLISFGLIGQDAFTHQVTKRNTNSNFTTIDHSSCNGNPDAILTITPNWKGVYNPHPVGVWYNNGMWTIYNEDKAMMPLKAHFNVLVHNGNNFSIQSDEKGSVTVKTRKGSVSITASGDITVKGNTITLAATNKTTVKGINVSLEASQELMLKGMNIEISAKLMTTLTSTAVINIKTSGQLALNGALIMLNKGGAPAARVSDIVTANRIITGSATVLIGQ